ncbi:hypothetical protein QO002_001120 [Pararhizobium capsulatum DSM 1112]|uniref:Uncharacterized protein n=1 Tax=Pararhizobium capsulatum DSM 1112 TaxID=1121113 RepID=A0ABU0BQ27_9HYPH|nr:hypothetical protein [Pararhizobium capsulatum]MDQ0318982.1 hypothetical protein [Pararhizobium capsulatum DSM 1112]
MSNTNVPTPQPKAKINWNLTYDSPKKFEVSRFLQHQLECEQAAHPGTWRAYFVEGLRAATWNVFTPLVRSLNLRADFLLLVVKRDDKLTVVAKLYLPPKAVARFDAIGKAEYAAADEDWRIIYVSLSGVDDDEEVRRMVAYPLRLAAWAAKRLGPATQAWAEERL